jgi:AI-2 transport protein TqsA
MATSGDIIVQASLRPYGVLLGICTLILVCGALYVAQSVFAPVAFALFVIAMVWPLQRTLQAALPTIVALAISLLVTTVVMIAFGSVIAWGFGRIVRSIINDAPRLQGLYLQMSAWLEGHGIILAGLWAEHFNVGWVIRLAQDVTSRANSTLTFLLIVLTYVMLGLLEVDEVADKLRVSGREAGRILLVGGARSAVKLRRYMIIRTKMSIVTGLLVWAFAALMGLEHRVEWGVIAFALNYIPFIGPFIATVFPTLYAMAQFESWQVTIFVFTCLNLIQFLVGSYLEPRISGSALSISPSLVLFSVFFWTFLWGIAGTFIGVPIMVAVLTICELHPSSRWVAALLGGAPIAPTLPPRDRDGVQVVTSAGTPDSSLTADRGEWEP